MRTIPVAVRVAFLRALVGRPHRFSRRCGGTIRLHHRPAGASWDWELTFVAEEADAVAAWVRAGASGPLPVPEHLGEWRSDYRWTERAWAQSLTDPRCIGVAS